MKIIKSPILNRLLLLCFLFTLFVIINAFSYVNAITNSISNNLFRLHVIANSNSTEDQELKYLVKSEILLYINEMVADLNNVEEVIAFTQNNIDDITLVAQNAVYSNGYNYPVNAQIGNFRFPTKKYGDITLPPGFYNALKIEIGDNAGRNWWCVMFPPLCFVNVSTGTVPDSSREIMRESLSTEEYSVISDTSPEVRVKFRVVEVFQNIGARI